MQGANEESYEQAISQLTNFFAETSEICNKMKSIGNDCVANTNNDPAAVKANAKLGECVGTIAGALAQITDVIRALQDELAAIREAAAKANSF